MTLGHFTLIGIDRPSCQTAYTLHPTALIADSQGGSKLLWVEVSLNSLYTCQDHPAAHNRAREPSSLHHSCLGCSLMPTWPLLQGSWTPASTTWSAQPTRAEIYVVGEWFCTILPLAFHHRYIVSYSRVTGGPTLCTGECSANDSQYLCGGWVIFIGFISM